MTAFAVFMLAHRIPTIPRLKTGLQARLGARGFTLGYSVLSTVLLIWLIAAAGSAPVMLLWDQTLWQRWLVNLVMPLAIVLAVFAIGAPNPLSFGGRKSGFDPAHPGLAGLVRHPLLLALALWSGAHLFANGDVAHVLLFGSFLVFSLFGMVAIDARNKRMMGPQEWQRLAQNTSLWPLVAWIMGRWHPRSGPSPWRLAIAIGLWAALYWLHRPVIGVMPTP